MKKILAVFFVAMVVSHIDIGAKIGMSSLGIPGAQKIKRKVSAGAKKVGRGAKRLKELGGLLKNKTKEELIELIMALNVLKKHKILSSITGIASMAGVAAAGLGVVAGGAYLTKGRLWGKDLGSITLRDIEPNEFTSKGDLEQNDIVVQDFGTLKSDGTLEVSVSVLKKNGITFFEYASDREYSLKDKNENYFPIGVVKEETEKKTEGAPEKGKKAFLYKENSIDNVTKFTLNSDDIARARKFGFLPKVEEDLVKAIAKIKQDDVNEVIYSDLYALLYKEGVAGDKENIREKLNRMGQLDLNAIQREVQILRLSSDIAAINKKDVTEETYPNLHALLQEQDVAGNKENIRKALDKKNELVNIQREVKQLKEKK